MNVINTYFIDVIKNHYVDFKGRATRTQFWMWQLWTFVLGIIIMLLGQIVGENVSNIISTIISLALFLPSLSIAARRLHDIGRSGWWLLLYFLPVIGWLILFIFWLLPSKQ